MPGYGFFEILNSAWPGRLIAYNRHAFPDRTPPHYAALRHYFIGCHASGEFLARDMKIEATTGSYGEAAREALQRAAGPANEWRQARIMHSTASQKCGLSPCHQLPISQ